MDKQFDYRVEYIPSHYEPVKIETHLKSLGAYGWQLVTVVGKDVYIFERPR